MSIPPHVIARALLLAVLSWFATLGTPSFAQSQAPSFQSQQERRELTPEERERLQEQMRLAEEQAAQACAVCGGGLLTLVGVAVGLLILNVVLLIWVARDAKARGMDSAILWMFLVMFTSFIGLIIYLCSRPQGDLTSCRHCGGKRLSVSAICPHCRHP